MGIRDAPSRPREVQVTSDCREVRKAFSEKTPVFSRVSQAATPVLFPKNAKILLIRQRFTDKTVHLCCRPPRGGRGLKSPSSSAAGGSSPVAPSRGAWIEIAAHTAPRRTRPSPLRPVCPPGAPSCRPEKSSFVPSVVMYPVSFQLFVSPKNSFADFTWPFFSASE